MRCLKPKDILCLVRSRELASTCSECEFNSLLNRVYTYFSDTKFLEEAIEFNGGSQGAIEMQTLDGSIISHIKGIYVKASDECMKSSRCWIEEARCADCDEKIYRIPHTRTPMLTRDGDYKIENDKLSIYIDHKCHAGGFVIYARGPKLLESYDDELCLTEEEITVIQMMASLVGAENAGDYQMAQYFEREIFKWRERLNEKDKKLLSKIGGTNFTYRG